MRTQLASVNGLQFMGQRQKNGEASRVGPSGPPAKLDRQGSSISVKSAVLSEAQILELLQLQRENRLQEKEAKRHKRMARRASQERMDLMQALETRLYQVCGSKFGRQKQKKIKASRTEETNSEEGGPLTAPTNDDTSSAVTNNQIDHVKTAACAKAETDEMLPHEHMDESEVANTDENSAECDEELHVSTWNLGLFKPVDDVEAQETFESLDCTVAPDEAGEIDPIVSEGDGLDKDYRIDLFEFRDTIRISETEVEDTRSYTISISTNDDDVISIEGIDESYIESGDIVEAVAFAIGVAQEGSFISETRGALTESHADSLQSSREWGSSILESDNESIEDDIEDNVELCAVSVEDVSDVDPKASWSPAMVRAVAKVNNADKKVRTFAEAMIKERISRSQSMEDAIRLIEGADTKSKHAGMGVIRSSSRISICLQ